MRFRAPPPPTYPDMTDSIRLILATAGIALITIILDRRARR